MNWFRGFFDISQMGSTAPQTTDVHSAFAVIVICRIFSHLPLIGIGSAPTIYRTHAEMVCEREMISQCHSREQLPHLCGGAEQMCAGGGVMESSAQHSTSHRRSTPPTQTIRSDVEIMMDDSFRSISMTFRWISRRSFHHPPRAHQTAPSIRTPCFHGTSSTAPRIDWQLHLIIHFNWSENWFEYINFLGVTSVLCSAITEWTDTYTKIEDKNSR